MPIEFKKEGNACERCKKLDTEVEPITYYTDPHDGYNGLLCSECIKRREKPYAGICPICKQVAYEHGGLTYYDDSDADDSKDFDIIDNDNHDGLDNFDLDEKPPSFESMCMECHDKKVARVRKIRKAKLTIKNFAKDHWKFWISICISIVAVAIALSRL